jgi:hypothetical protein
MTTGNFCFYLQNRLIQNSQTGGQWYSDTSPFSIPCLYTFSLAHCFFRIMTSLLHAGFKLASEPLVFSTVDLLVLTSLVKLFFDIENIIFLIQFTPLY